MAKSLLRFRPVILAVFAVLVHGVFFVPSVLAQTMPSFQLPAVNGGTVDSGKLAGQVVLVNFWATWCPACRQEISILQQLHEEFAGQDFIVVGIAMDKGGPTVVAQFAGKNGLTYSLAMGNGDIAAAFGGISSLPTSFLVGRDGRVIESYAGFVSHARMTRDIKSLLAGANPVK